MTRRRFLHQLGLAGGGAVACRAMAAMGLLPAHARAAHAFELLHTGPANGKRVVVLGAGLAGLCAAYELDKVGYDCRVLEARDRPGGRCVTVRNGFVQRETDGAEQVARFDEGVYFNPGPTRFPPHHLTMDYCRELGVAVEPFCNVNDAAWHCAAGKRVRLRDARPGAAPASADVAELLAKVANPDQLDQPLSREERAALLELLRGGGRGGDPQARELVMFQTVGGIDRLAHAFAERMPRRIEYGARVSEIRQHDGGVLVRYVDAHGAAREASADYCVCTIPPPVLKSIDADFSGDMKRAIAAVEFAAASKIGLQFKRRFWEEDDRIFGGISQTDQCITQIIYPSYGWLGAKGLVVGCYNYGDDARAIARLAPAERVERALREGEQVHPRQYKAAFEHGFSMAWEKVPFTQGAWSADGRGHDRLKHPDGRVYLAGEHVTMMGGWMAGALESARAVSEMIHARVQRG